MQQIGNVQQYYVICYVKMDHLGFFINVEFFSPAWMDSAFCVEYNGKVSSEKDDHRLRYDQFWILGS